KSLHDARQALAAEDAQQRILERQVETRAAGVALAPRAAAKLVVDPPRFVPLGADDVEATRLDHVVVANLPFGTKALDLAVSLGGQQRFVLANLENLRLDAAAQNDIGAAPRHVGRDRDHAGLAGLRNDLRFPRVLLRVQDVVRQL